MRISLGPTGKLIKGDVLDVNKDSLEMALKAYDSKLYIKWNPNKQYGYGTWELRREPNQKKIVHAASVKGQNFYKIDYIENDMENHVFDMPLLTYNYLVKLKRIDMWSAAGYDGHNTAKTTRLISQIEQNGVDHKNKIVEDARKEAIYQMMQDREYFNRFKEDIKSGLNPAELAKHWK